MRQIQQILIRSNQPTVTNVGWLNPETKEFKIFDNGEWVNYSGVSDSEIATLQEIDALFYGGGGGSSSSESGGSEDSGTSSEDSATI